MNDLTKNSTKRNVDPNEIEKFSLIASEWWNPHGKFKPLHRLSQIRLAYILDQTSNQFSRGNQNSQSLRNLDIVDIGCGGGLICEPLARLGANVTGIDPAEENIAVARKHCADQELEISYQTSTVQELADSGMKFDVAVCLEVLEHVPDIESFLLECNSLLNQNGIMIMSTINRTLKSYALAIVGAEYILRWLPAGTHDWNRFIKPDELRDALAKGNLDLRNVSGLIYNPVIDTWKLSDDMDVNYFATAVPN